MRIVRYKDTCFARRRGALTESISCSCTRSLFFVGGEMDKRFSNFPFCPSIATVWLGFWRKGGCLWEFRNRGLRQSDKFYNSLIMLGVYLHVLEVVFHWRASQRILSAEAWIRQNFAPR